MTDKIISQYERDAVLKDLRSFVAEITFKQNPDGASVGARSLRLTLMPAHLPKDHNLQEEKQYHTDNPSNIAAWNVRGGGWVAFDVNAVEYIQIIDGY